MSFIDWNAGAESAQAALGQQALQSQQLDQMQKLRGLSALQGLNLNDPESLNGSINALARLGLTDQASALSGLYRTSAVNAFGADVAQTSQQQYDQQQQGASGNAQNVERQQQLLNQANVALNDLLGTTDPTERQTKADHYRSIFQGEGVPEDRLDEVLGGDITNNENLRLHQANIQREMVTSQQGYAQSANNLANMPNPEAIGMMAANGMDPTAGLHLSNDIVSGARNASTSLATTGPLAQEQGFGGTAGSNTGGAATAGAVRKVAQAQAGGSAAGTAPYKPITIQMADGSSIQATPSTDANGNVSGWSQVQPGGAAAASGGGNAPTANTGFGATPSPQAQNVLTAGGEQLAADRAANSASMNQGVALHKILDLLPTTNTGPGTQVTNQWRSFLLSQFPILERFNPNLKEDQLQTAGANELRKYMVQVASAQAAQFGQGTNEKLAVAASGNPNTEMDALSARDVTRTTLAILRAQQAKTILWDQQHPNPADVGGYGAFASNYATQVDPRAFMLDMMSASERQKMLAGITSPNDRKRFARGVIDAEQAGFINRADLPK